MREIHRTYTDPLELIWLATASRLGIEVERSDEVFASWDGTSVLTLSNDAELDRDDCLAQMIFPATLGMFLRIGGSPLELSRDF